MPRSPKARKPELPGYAISDLKTLQCRFAITPHDAPSHRFCGEPTTDPKVPWCACHQKIVFDLRTKEQMRRDAERAAKARAAIRSEKNPHHWPKGDIASNETDV